jgi:hypothetical protein
MANALNTCTVTCNIASSPGTTVYTYTVPTTDTYNVAITLQLPKADPVMSAYGANAGAGTGTSTGTQTQSAVVTVVKKNSTTLYTSAAGDRGVFLNNQSATANDTITVNLYSSSSIDQQPQAVQATIAISEGAF